MILSQKDDMTAIIIQRKTRNKRLEKKRGQEKYLREQILRKYDEDDSNSVIRHKMKQHNVT